jgi:hypothetical protein
VAPLVLVVSRACAKDGGSIPRLVAVLREDLKCASISRQSGSHPRYLALKGTSREDRRSQP